MARTAPPSSSLGSALLLLLCVGGIYSAYLTQGLVSESLAQKRYGAEQERFKNLEALNGAQSLCCFVWAYLILQVMLATGAVKSDQTARWFEYWQAGITNSIGPAFGMVALKNITYSAQVLVKSCKMVPVMVRASHACMRSGAMQKPPLTHPRATTARSLPARCCTGSGTAWQSTSA
jgi:hypothetical protein